MRMTTADSRQQTALPQQTDYYLSGSVPDFWLGGTELVEHSCVCFHTWHPRMVFAANPHLGGLLRY
jgi:hypothetical protein